ncbi:hypothetical protein BJP24_16130 [Aeromonas allosaccharophila]|uniref:glycosyltransferase n=1 Tax=Aeromonas TaxID=642 RepID=UPI000959D8A6|nr:MULTISPECIES: glycosyltransferase [Aeromonas]OKP43597.1 hypothetical protein BJP24_16130 [Aeromonas allosaccharophila]BBU03917.1 PGL/p-HBAD biosynthesis glycosyltransferase [Aeromonas veronii]
MTGCQLIGRNFDRKYSGILTVVIPTYNCADYLNDCMNGLLDKCNSFIGNGINVCIIDGGSTDNTKEIASSFCELHSSISFVSERDNGVYDAMNKGIKLSNTPWIYFLGSDDCVTENFTNILNVLKFDTEYSNVHVFPVRMLSDGRTVNISGSLFYFIFKNVCHQGVVYPTKVFDSVRYSLKYPVLADWALNIELFKFFRFHHDFDEISIYNDITGLSKSSKDLSFINDKSLLFKRHHGVVPFLISKMLFWCGKFKNAI